MNHFYQAFTAIKKLPVCLLLFLGFTGFAVAQAPVTRSSSDIYLQLKKLDVLGAVLYVAAHPDDENTRLLAYFSKERLYRAGYLSLTRGDGGQNLIGNEQGIDLGLIRTQELLAARRIDGAEQFFTRAFDFGYSKSTQEALKTWNKEKILSDVVWVIRKFRPDVIITRFPEDDRAGHGHHSGSAVLAREAFTAAADPKRFTEQFEHGVKPWQAKRIFWNTYNFGTSRNIDTLKDLRLDVGAYNSILGKGYGEIAAESRSQHKSQGFGVAAARGEQFEFFKLTGGEAFTKDVADGVDVGWKRVAGGEKIHLAIESIIRNYSLIQPEKSIPALVALYRQIKSMPENDWKQQKLAEVQDLVIACSGLWVEAYNNNAYAIQGDSIRVNFFLNNRLGRSVQLEHIRLENFDTSLSIKAQPNSNILIYRTMFVPASKELTQPFWLLNKMDGATYSISKQDLIGKPDVDPSYTAEFSVRIEGEAFTIRRPVQYKYTDPVKGEMYEPLVVVPAVSVSANPAVMVFKKQEKEQQALSVRLQANRALSGYRAEVTKKTSTSNSTKTDTSFSLSPGSFRDYTFFLSNSELSNRTLDVAHVSVKLRNGQEQPLADKHITSIRYDHIPPIHYFYTDSVKIVNIDLLTAGKRIGYIEGAGDKVPQALREMGYEVVLLNESNLVPGFLKQFDAVITGIRAYNVHAYLSNRYDALMEYINEGGNLIVQYNTNSFVGPMRSRIAPYPLAISRTRITDENSPVRFLLPDHAVLNYPNKITQEDFQGWVQERGIYFADQLATNYETPLAFQDPGEKEEPGSLVITNYGKGKFVYTGLVFFRQLPAGVPGAYRLLANIIALNQKKSF